MGNKAATFVVERMPNRRIRKTYNPDQGDRFLLDVVAFGK
jgi:hypothetical protein